MSRNSQNSGSKPAYAVVPPPNFSYVEDTLCRCTYPLSQNNIAFLRSIGVGVVINLCDGKSSLALQRTLAQQQDIILVSLIMESPSHPFTLDILMYVLPVTPNNATVYCRKLLLGQSWMISRLRVWPPLSCGLPQCWS